MTTLATRPRAASDRHRLADLADEVVVDAVIGGAARQRPRGRADRRPRQGVQEQQADERPPQRAG